jgi:hypothetical protein
VHPAHARIRWRHLDGGLEEQGRLTLAILGEEQLGVRAIARGEWDDVE